MIIKKKAKKGDRQIKPQIKEKRGQAGYIKTSEKVTVRLKPKWLTFNRK
jgi:hypothetical protein